MAKTTALLAGLAALLASPIALAVIDYEPVFSYWGSSAVLIPREPGAYRDQPSAAVEIECNGLAGSGPGSRHLLMTTQEARDLADSIHDAADVADAL